MTQGLSPPKARDIPSWRCVVLHVTKRRTAKPLIVMLDYKKFQDHTNANGFGTWSELATESRTAVYRFLEDWLRRNNQSMLNWNWDLSAIEHLGEDEHRVRKLVLRVLPQCFVPTEEEDNAMVMLVAKPLASYFAKPSSEPQVSIRRARRSFSAEQSLSPLLRCADGPFRFNKIKLDPVVLDDKVRIIYPDADDTSPQGSDVQPYAGPAPITPSNGAEANEIHLKHGRISSMGPSGDSERPSPDMSPYSTALGRRVMIPRSSTQSTGRRHAMKGLRPIQRDKNDDERLRDEILLQYTGKRLGDLVDGRK